MSGDALGAILTMVTALQEGMARLERSQEKLERGHERLRVDLMERMDRLDNALTAMLTHRGRAGE